MNSPAISLLFVASVLVSGANGFLFSRSQSSSTNQLTNSFSTNNCMCLHKLFQMLGGGGGGGGGGGWLQALGKREVADMLDLEEDYPGLEEFMEHADVKRDGVLTMREFRRAVRQAASNPSQNNNPNLCHCGRMVVDPFNPEL